MESLGVFIQNNKFIEIIYLGGNYITDKSFEILLPYLFANTTLKKLGVSYNEGITDESVPLLIDIAKICCLEIVDIKRTSITSLKEQQILSKFKTPIDQREIPLITIENVKSASKLS